MTAPPPSAPLIANGTDLSEFLAACPSGAPCALDTEADSLYSYREKLCLLQFACGDKIAVIDPLAEIDLTPFWDWLDRAPVVWMHGADYDMSILRRSCGRLPPTLYDTQIAARLLGWRRFGLAHLIQEFFGVELSKQSQKKNWGERPLPAKMLAYAADDVRYIMPMAERLCERLKEWGRWDWFLESCHSAREQVLSRQDKSRDEAWRVPGWGRLQGRALAYLRELWGWRDDLAARRDKPPFKIISNDEIIEFAVNLSAGKPAELPQRFPGSARRKFHEAVHRAAALPPDQFPERMRRKRVARPGDCEEIFETMRRQRDQSARKLEIDPSIIAPKSALERYAFALPEERTPDLKASLFLNWQAALVFGDEEGK